MNKILIGLLFLPLLCAALVLSGCAGGNRPQEKPVKRTYMQISQKKAAEMMARDDGHIVLDVRRRDEYDAGHIPGAVLLPNESIGPDRPALLQDPEQVILIYCRSGNRSKQAAQKLCDMGYVNVYEFGGINTWEGEIVREPDPGAVRPSATLVAEAGGRIFYASLEDNRSAAALTEKLSPGAAEVTLTDRDGCGKEGPLPWSLPEDDRELEAKPGDLVLAEGRLLVVYKAGKVSGTPLANIYVADREAFAKALGEGSVTVKLYLEWSE